MIARREFDFWTGPHAAKPLFHHSVENAEIDHLVDAEAAGRVTLFDTSLQVAPGIRIVEVGGHTPGQSVVFVDTDEGTVLLASDAVHYYEEFERDMIFTSVADLVAMYDCFASIRNLVETGEVAHVVSGHDPDTLDRFKAATGDLAGYASTIGSIASRIPRTSHELQEVRRSGSCRHRRRERSGTRIRATVVGGGRQSRRRRHRRGQPHAVSAGLPTESIAVQADISTEEGVDAYVDAALAAFGPIDLHHLNAGIFGSFDPLPDLTVDDFERVMNVNVRGQFLGLRAAFRLFRATPQHRGHCGDSVDRQPHRQR